MFTTIVHPIRKMYCLSLIDYCVLEEIRILSQDNNKYGGWCVKKREKIADSLDIGRATVFRSLNTLKEKELIEQNESDSLRCSDEWLRILKMKEFNAFSNGETVSLKMIPSQSQNDTVQSQNDTQQGLKMIPKVYNIDIHKDIHISKEKNTKKEKDDMFDFFWKMYPNKKAKKIARASWDKLEINEELYRKIILSLQEQTQTRNWQKEDGQYIPHPATWLNQERWNDEQVEEVFEPLNF